MLSVFELPLIQGKCFAYSKIKTSETRRFTIRITVGTIDGDTKKYTLMLANRLYIIYP